MSFSSWGHLNLGRKMVKKLAYTLGNDEKVKQTKSFQKGLNCQTIFNLKHVHL